MSQEFWVTLIVGFAVLGVVIRFFRVYCAESFAKFLLKTGRVKWAMKVRAQAKKPGCSDC